MLKKRGLLQQDNFKIPSNRHNLFSSPLMDSIGAHFFHFCVLFVIYKYAFFMDFFFFYPPS